MANQTDQIQQAITAAIRAEMSDLRGFVDRRIAELSAEIHATVELMDFSETNLSGQLKGIREQIAGLLAIQYPRRVEAMPTDWMLERQAVAGSVSMAKEAPAPGQDTVDSVFDSRPAVLAVR